MKRRVNLACSVMHSPSILLLDEPFAALGPALKTEMLSLLTGIADSTDANAVHGSDAPETAAVEIAFFFPAMGVYSR